MKIKSAIVMIAIAIAIVANPAPAEAKLFSGVTIGYEVNSKEFYFGDVNVSRIGECAKNFAGHDWKKFGKTAIRRGGGFKNSLLYMRDRARIRTPDHCKRR